MGNKREAVEAVKLYRYTWKDGSGVVRVSAWTSQAIDEWAAGGLTWPVKLTGKDGAQVGLDEKSKILLVEENVVKLPTNDVRDVLAAEEAAKKSKAPKDKAPGGRP